MVKKLLIRLVSSLAMLLVFTIALQGTAQAYASKVIINTGYKPWYTTETTPVSDVDVTVETVADAANAIPRNDSDKINPAERIFTRDAVNCPNGCHIGVNNAFGTHPTTNSYTFGMKDSFLNSLAAGSVSTVNNVIGGGSLQNMELPQFAWCVGDDANGIPIFKFKTSLSQVHHRRSCRRWWRWWRMLQLWWWRRCGWWIRKKDHQCTNTQRDRSSHCRCWWHRRTASIPWRYRGDHIVWIAL
jgi:hypothetical protein